MRKHEAIDCAVEALQDKLDELHGGNEYERVLRAIKELQEMKQECLKAGPKEKYTTVMLYYGEVNKPEYQMKQPDCFQFNSVAEAAEWLAAETNAAVSTVKQYLYNILNGKYKHYKGYTVTVAYRQ